MDDEQLVADGLAGRLEPDTPAFERFVAAHYCDPQEHEESFAIALEALQLRREDRYVELCFEGGQVLERALGTVHSAAGIDHSPDMLALARSRNAEALAAGRLELAEGDVHELPWSDAAFTCAACLNAFFFIDRPADFLAEVRRVLAPGGRFVLVTARSTADASTGPWDPALRRYEPAVLRAMLLDAGFAEATVEEGDDGPQVARAHA